MGVTTSFGFAGFSAFSINDFFVDGLNTLDFVVQNSGGPTGLRVELYGSANLVSSVPVPAAVWFFGSGLIGLFSIRKKHALA